MRDSDFYPAGACNDPSAPYNISDPPTKIIDVFCEQTITKDVDSVEVEYDDYDESYIDLEYDYKEQHSTPIEIINKFKEVLEKHPKLLPNQDYWLKECSDWTDVETTIDEQ